MMRLIICGVLLTLATTVVLASGDQEPPDTAFGIEGSELLYDRDDELRWTYDADTGAMTIQTTRDHVWTVEVISKNVLKLTSPRYRDRYLLRIGSPEYQRMQAFRECVAANRGRKLFEVEDCGELPPGIGE